LHSKAERQVLVNSGATNNFINPKLLRRMKIGQVPLQKTWTIWNIDGTHNKAGSITHYVDLQVRVGTKVQDMKFLVTNIREDEIILRYPWLAAFQPIINWKEVVLNKSMQPMVIKTLGLPIEDKVVRGTKAWIHRAKALAEEGEEVFVTNKTRNTYADLHSSTNGCKSTAKRRKDMGTDSSSAVSQMEEGFL
jgi:hypothetical protein